MDGCLSMTVSKEEREQAINRSHMMFETDTISDINTLLDKGDNRNALKIARNALRMNMIIDVIVENTGLTLEDMALNMPTVWDDRVKSKALDVARYMISDKEPLEKIIRYTSLTLKEIESLRDAD